MMYTKRGRVQYDKRSKRGWRRMLTGDKDRNNKGNGGRKYRQPSPRK